MTRRLMIATFGIVTAIMLSGCSNNNHITHNQSNVNNQHIIGPKNNQSSTTPTTSSAPDTKQSAPVNNSTKISPSPATSTAPLVTSGTEVTTAEKLLLLYIDYNWSTTPNQLTQLRQQLSQVATPTLTTQAMEQWEGTPGIQLQQQQAVNQATISKAEVNPSNPNSVSAIVIITLQSRGILTPQQQNQLWSVTLTKSPSGSWLAQSVKQTAIYPN